MDSPLREGHPIQSDSTAQTLTARAHSPLRSQLGDGGLPIQSDFSPKTLTGRAYSPPGSPLRDGGLPIQSDLSPKALTGRAYSPPGSPLRDGGLPIQSDFYPKALTGRACSPPGSPLQDGSLLIRSSPTPQKNSSLRSHLQDVGRPIPLPVPENQVEKSPFPSPETAIVYRVAREEPPVVTKVEGGGGAGERDAERGSRVVSGILRRTRMQKSVARAAIGVRVSAVVLCLVSFSVMAADKTRGWAGDSFDRYREYRYCISVNIIAFVYSGFQAYAQVQHLINGTHIIRPPIRFFFDFAMDQILAYLLISASSAAATRNEDWISNWGNDEFTVMANGSISVSFLAFAALALSSLISAYNLFNRNL